MRSRYSIRIYELIKSLQFSEVPNDSYEYTYDISELKQLLKAENHKTYQHFNNCVLVPAEREINEYTDKALKYEPIRHGRAVKEIKFIISNKPTYDVIKVRAKIEKILGPEQYTIWDQMIHGKQQEPAPEQPRQ